MGALEAPHAMQVTARFSTLATPGVGEVAGNKGAGAGWEIGSTTV